MRTVPTVKAHRAAIMTTAGPSRWIRNPVKRAAQRPLMVTGLNQAVASSGDAPRDSWKNCQVYQIQMPKLPQPHAMAASTNETSDESASNGIRGWLA